MQLTNSLIHTQNQTRRLRRRLHGINLHQTRLPNKRLHIISHALIIKIHTRPRIPLSVLDAQLCKDIRGVEAGIIAELAGNNFKGFSEGFDDGLLFAGHGEVGGAVEVGGDFHFAGSAAGDDVAVADGAFDDHDGVVETSFYFCDELFGASSEDERACLCGGAAFEEIESLAADLALFESFAGAEMLGSDVGTCC